jgi:hypothetical protein
MGRIERFAVVLTALILSAGRGIGGIDLTVDRTAMRRAIDSARWPSTDAERERFHRRYVFDVPVRRDDVPLTVDRIEVITTYRRLVLIAEEHARLNDLFGRPGLTDVDEAIRPWRGQVWVTAHVKFLALNQVPALLPRLSIVLGGDTIATASAARQRPFYGNCALDTDCAITEATLESAFDAAPIARATREVIVRFDERPLANVTVNFGAID